MAVGATQELRQSAHKEGECANLQHGQSSLNHCYEDWSVASGLCASSPPQIWNMNIAIPPHITGLLFHVTEFIYAVLCSSVVERMIYMQVQV